MVDVELLQTGQVGQTKVLQLLNVVLLQVQSHQAAQRRQSHGAELGRDRKSSGVFVTGGPPPVAPEYLCEVVLGEVQLRQVPEALELSGDGGDVVALWFPACFPSLIIHQFQLH